MIQITDLLRFRLETVESSDYSGLQSQTAIIIFEGMCKKFQEIKSFAAPRKKNTVTMVGVDLPA